MNPTALRVTKPSSARRPSLDEVTGRARARSSVALLRRVLPENVETGIDVAAFGSSI